MIGLRVSYARPAILVDVAQASSGYVAENTSVRVVASLSYRFLVADALADYDSKHRFFGDSVDVSDAAALTFIKGLADSVDAVDAVAISLQKWLADSVDATDGVLIVVDWVRAFADSVSASDAAAIGVAKALSDGVTAGGSNLLANSEDFSAWLGTAPVTADADLSPFGELAADVITDDSAVAWRYRYQAIDQFDVAATYRAFAYIKKDAVVRSDRFPMLRLSFQGSTNQYADVMLDTATGEISSSGAALLAASVESVGDDWRLSVTGKSVDGANSTAYAWLYPAAGASAAWALSATAMGSITAFGGQAVKGAGYCHYVKTGASAKDGTEAVITVRESGALNASPLNETAINSSISRSYSV